MQYTYQTQPSPVTPQGTQSQSVPQFQAPTATTPRYDLGPAPKLGRAVLGVSGQLLADLPAPSIASPLPGQSSSQWFPSPRVRFCTGGLPVCVCVPVARLYARTDTHFPLLLRFSSVSLGLE